MNVLCMFQTHYEHCPKNPTKYFNNMPTLQLGLEAKSMVLPMLSNIGTRFLKQQSVMNNWGGEAIKTIYLLIIINTLIIIGSHILLW